ncbi:hypothetical protein CALCODRAFT_431520 [Calocera cornea HHB12733]|uniref:UBX domain-containing protein n=1 Tax=Calocera cornea HHB12733 TaxID=1353952 RepID=A0A165HC76_9BASI|nr:hypothetical protein CALCODRAFT_431520 [Calocera cornea HHB12733]
MSDRNTLLDFGFAPERVDWALKATNNAGLQPALDHLEQHQDDAVPDLSTVTAGKSSAAPADDDDDDDEGAVALSASTSAEAKSIRCSVCGKIFKNTALANYHAEKSGHDQFEESTEEIKPLTEEEKKQKLEELRVRMLEKKAVKAKAEAEENKKNEAIRRRAGRDAGAIREDLEKKEAIKQAQQARQDKIAEAKAKAAVKAQIEADKRARAEKAAREKALREGKVYDAAAGPAVQPTAAAAATSANAGVKGKDYPETRLQIRLASGGQPYTTTLSSDAPLSEVAEFVASQNLAFSADTVTLSMHFPRKTFSPSDMKRSLRELGLTPSAVRRFSVCSPSKPAADLLAGADRFMSLRALGLRETNTTMHFCTTYNDCLRMYLQRTEGRWERPPSQWMRSECQNETREIETTARTK